MKGQTVINVIILISCGFYLINCQLVPVFEEEPISKGRKIDENGAGTPISENQTLNNGPNLHGENNDYPSIEQEFKSEVKQYKEQVCTPMFNLNPYPENDLQRANFLNKSTESESKLNFSLSIDDIDMPVAPPSGSINSAIKLLSSFNEQFETESSPDSDIADNVVKFRENNLKIEGFNLTMLNIHLYPSNDPKFGVGITIKNTTLTGKFSYKAPTFLTSSPITGFYRMRVDNIFVVATSNLTKQKFITYHDGGRTRFGHQLVSQDLRVNITNLGYISIDILDSAGSSKPTSNYILRMLQRVLQKSIKRTYYTFESYLRSRLEEESKKVLDCELTRFTPLLADSTTSSGQNEDLSKIIGSEIKRLGYDHVNLPDFDYQQSVFGRNLTIHLYLGSLSNLNNIKLIGETRVKLQDEYLFANTSIGWTNLFPTYRWILLSGNNSDSLARGYVSFDIKAVDFDSVITKGLRPHTGIVVDRLIIKRLDNPKMDIDGLPGLNRITKVIVNLFMGQLKKRISGWIQPTLKQQLEKSLNKMRLFNSF